MPLSNYEINLLLTWSAKSVLSNDEEATTHAIADTKLQVPDTTLSTQDNAKLFEQLISGFKKTINQNRYQTKLSPERPNKYLDFLIYPSFRRVNRLFLLLFQNEDNRTVHTKYCLPIIEIKHYNVIINGHNIFD